MTTFLGKTVDKIKPLELKVASNGRDFDNFGTRPVFLVRFTDGSKLVIKAEMVQTQTPGLALKSAVFIGGLHSSVTGDLKVVEVARDELKELANAPETEYDFSIPAAAQNYLRALVLEAGEMFVWYTMEFFEALKSLEKQAEKNKDHENMQKVGAYKLACKMRNDGRLLADLGKVVAVDLFSGNKDRFAIDGSIVNKGNIVFTKNADKTYSPLGVDFYESANAAANMYAHVNDPTTWGGKVLADDAKIQAFATKAIDELNKLFAAALAPRGMPVEGLLGLPEATAMANGIRNGAAALRDHLKALERKGKPLPSGVTSRMKLLAWDQWNFNGWQTVRPQAPTHVQAAPSMGWKGAAPTHASSSASSSAVPRTSPNTSPNTSPLRPRSNGQPPPNWHK